MAKELWEKTKAFTLKSKRVWMALKKPTREEFMSVTKISALGILILGVVGFAISVAMDVFN